MMLERAAPKATRRTEKPLAQKVALVSGCANARGFGRAIAYRLACDGADVLLTDVTHDSVDPGHSEKLKHAQLEQAVDDIYQLGSRASYAIADVQLSSDVDRLIEKTMATFGRLDILVNNAAAPPGADRMPLVNVSEAAWDTVIDTNLKGTFLMTRAAAKLMIEQASGGRIINISSVTGKIPYANMAAYSASKAGILGFSRAAAAELAPHSITVNAVCPGVADTNRIDYVGKQADGRFDPALRSTRLADRAKSIPLGRIATPEDVAGVVAFLASREADYLTGEFINIAGGYVMD